MIKRGPGTWFCAKHRSITKYSEAAPFTNALKGCRFKQKHMYSHKSILLILFFICRVPSSSCQQLTFSKEESYDIHDSINKSRWDWGGMISDYSFRHMSEFFPVGVIQKSEKAFSFRLAIDSS